MTFFVESRTLSRQPAGGPPSVARTLQEVRTMRKIFLALIVVTTALSMVACTGGGACCGG